MLKHLEQFQASIYVCEDAQPIFLKGRPFPHALKEKVEQDLREIEGIRDHLQGEPKRLDCPSSVVP